MNTASLAVHRFWRCYSAPAAKRFAYAMKHPEQSQRWVLDEIITCNVDTEFGRAHHFSKLKGMEDFQQEVPVRDYEDHKSWIQSAAAGKSDVLTPGKPLAFLPTSGTRTGAKLIPWTLPLKRQFQSAFGPWVHGFMHSHPSAWRGSVYWSLSPPVWPADRTAGGIAIGFDSDADYLPALFRYLLEKVFAVPSRVARLRDAQEWRYVTLLHLLAADDLSMISVWSPTFLVSLLDPLPEWWPSLLADLRHGTITPPAGTSPRASGIPRNPRRADELRALGEKPEYIWPRLIAISCWTHAAAAGPAKQVARMFPQTCVVPKGLIATEGVISIPWPKSAAPTLALTSHFLEFVGDDGLIYPAWDLRLNDCYSVLLTTGGGLYRYRLHDLIRVTGFWEQCPLIEFVGREGVTCDLCGEKLAEPFVRDCITQVLHELCQMWEFSMLAPASGSGLPRYILFLAGDASLDAAAVAHALDRKLCENPHYAHARRIAQLAPVCISLVPGGVSQAWKKFHSAQAARGQCSGDIKPTALDFHTGWEQVFEVFDSFPTI